MPDRRSGRQGKARRRAEETARMRDNRHYARDRPDEAKTSPGDLPNAAAACCTQRMHERDQTHEGAASDEVVELGSVDALKEHRQRGGVIVISDPVNDRQRRKPGPAIHDPYASHVQPQHLKSTLATGNGTYWWAPTVAAAQRAIPGAQRCEHTECFG